MKGEIGEERRREERRRDERRKGERRRDERTDGHEKCEM